jgi:hypothetical protein
MIHIWRLPTPDMLAIQLEHGHVDTVNVKTFIGSKILAPPNVAGVLPSYATNHYGVMNPTTSDRFYKLQSKVNSRAYARLKGSR